MKKRHYVVVIDTNKYSDEFSLALGAYVTNIQDNSESPMAVSNKNWIDENITMKMDCDNSKFESYCHQLYTPNWSLLKERFYEKDNKQSVGIFFKNKPTSDIIKQILERTIEFSKRFSKKSTSGNNRFEVTNIRLFETSSSVFINNYDQEPFKQIDNPYPYLLSEKDFTKIYNVRVASTEEEIISYSKNMTRLNQDNFNLVSAYFERDTDKYNQQYQKVLDLLYSIGYFLDNDISYDDIKREYEKSGISVDSNNEITEFSKNLIYISHENVPYSIVQNRDINSIPDNIRDYQLVIDRYHKKVKSVYEYLNQLNIGNIGNIWVVCSVHGMIEVIFGNHNGQLGVLKLGYENGVYKVSETLARVIANQTCSLKPTNEETYIYFKDMNIEKISVDLNKEEV